MDLIFNELSATPFPLDSTVGNERVKQLLEIAKTARPFGFNKIRFYDEKHTIQIAKDYFLSDWINNPSVNKIQKTALMGLYRHPYINDSDENEVNEYLSHSYYYKDSSNTNIVCKGLAAAYIYNTLSISFPNNEEWEKSIINIYSEPESIMNEIQLEVYNIFHETNFNLELIKDWLNQNLYRIIETEKDLEFFFPNYHFEKQAVEDFFYWKNIDLNLFKRLVLLLRDIKLNPFVGGIGKTELLKNNYSGYGSKRLTDEHRIIYKIDSGKIGINSCKGHYT